MQIMGTVTTTAGRFIKSELVSLFNVLVLYSSAWKLDGQRYFGSDVSLVQCFENTYTSDVHDLSRFLLSCKCHTNEYLKIFNCKRIRLSVIHVEIAAVHPQLCVLKSVNRGEQW